MKTILMALMVLGAVPAWAQAPARPPLQEYNPDIDKSAFAKSFIASMGYYGRLQRRLISEKDIGDQYDRDPAALKTLMDDRTLDNTELRIAKNYLTKYLGSKNMLIRKVAYDAIFAYEQNLKVSSAEKRLWQAYSRYVKMGRPRGLNEKDFKDQMASLARDRKAAGLAVLQTVMMFKKVILSAAACTDEDCKHLALTQSERDKLVKNINGFAGDNMAWGIKAGQGTFEAAVASLREILEDPEFVSKK